VDALLAGLRRTGVRLLLVGGASSLRTPDGVLVQDAPDFPPALRPIALACTDQLAACQAESRSGLDVPQPAHDAGTGPAHGSLPARR
jgi:putative NADH-flavin reductase